MTSRLSRVLSIAVVFILFLTVPSVAGMDRNLVESGYHNAESTFDTDGIDETQEFTWTDEIPVQTPRPAPSDLSWWVITSRDSNRNRIVDSLEDLIEPVASSVAGQEGQDDTESVPIVLSYSRTPDDDDIAALSELGFRGGYVVKAIDAISLGLVNPGMFTALSNLPGVVMVEPSGMVHLYSDVATRALKARESDEYSPESAWELTNVTGAGINVAVVDTGIDDGHPGLAGKRVAGYDAVTPEARTDGQDNPDDRHGHGTSCSGMATGTSAGDTDLRYMGSAPGASLVDVQIGTDIGAGPFENYLLPTTYYDSALRGIEWVRDNAHTEWSWVGSENYGIDVMSLSWGITSHEDQGSDGSDPFSRLIDEVVDAGVVSVGAAGNDGPNNDGLSGMSASSKAIIVGATDDHNTIDRTDDTIAGYSSRGPRKDNNDGYPYDELKPDVSAPGTNINNCEPKTWPEYGDAEDKGYEGRGSGTSYATPAVSGVVALILDANPDLSPDQVKGILHTTSERRGEPTLPELDPFWNRDFGYGMVDAYEAVKLAMEMKDGDLATIDVELQAYFTNVTETTSGGAVLSGLAWAKVGTVERVEISIDGGKWKEVKYAEELNGSVGAGEYVSWMYEVKSSSLSFDGNHTARVRAMSNEMYSMPDSTQFNGKEGDEDDDFSFSETSMLGVVGLLALLVLAVAMTRKKGGGRPGEVHAADAVEAEGVMDAADAGESASAMDAVDAEAVDEKGKAG